MPAKLRLTRRQTLGLAAGGALGAAGLRVFGLPLLGSSAGGLSAAGPSGAWGSPLGDSRALAAHLLRRAGFGYTATELDAAASLSYSDLVEKLTTQQPDPMPLPKALTQYQQVAATWYAHMATTAAPFPERMALFWHGHLTSDYRKANRFPFVYQQNLLYRRLGTSDLRSLLVETTADPLMMRYLDLDQSTGAAPNENYSRELMEIYTLGVGNFTEDDVREGARVLSGMRILVYDKSGQEITPPRPDKNNLALYYQQLEALTQAGATWKGVLDARLHDQGSKTFLGRTGNLSPTDAIDVILSQDACAPFIANSAITYFATPNPSNDYVARVAKTFRDSKYDISTMMRAIFTADDFKATSNYRSLVRSPADFMVATMKATDQANLATLAEAAGVGMDQVIYDPPTVAGWPSNGSWLSSSSVLARINFAAQVVTTAKNLSSPMEAVSVQLDNVVGPDLAKVYNASQTDGDRWYAILASPEFHLK